MFLGFYALFITNFGTDFCKNCEKYLSLDIYCTNNPSKVVNMIHRSSISVVLGRAPSLRHSVRLSVFWSVVPE